MRTFIPTAFAVLLAAAAPCAVLAETAPATPPAPAAADAPQLAADGVTPEKIELTHKLMVAMDIENTMKTRIDAMMKMMSKAMSQAEPNMSASDTQDFIDIENKFLNAYTPKMLDVMIKVYPEVYTEQELKDMLAFYQTPTGQAILKKGPLILERSTPYMAPIMSEMQVDMMGQMNDLVKKKLDAAKSAPKPDKTT